ncbi:hypothetical protein VV11_002410 [Trichodesmium erythraeum 21-75]|nr:hypothetical protein [Trichodesmium erythraeum 21-75]
MEIEVNSKKYNTKAVVNIIGQEGISVTITDLTKNESRELTATTKECSFELLMNLFWKKADTYPDLDDEIIFWIIELETKKLY